MVHKMQILLNIVEAHGEQLYMSFGVDKCKLLISGRQKKLTALENLLKAEPELLTFFGKPVSTVMSISHTLVYPRRPENNRKWLPSIGYLNVKIRPTNFKNHPKTPY